MKALLSSAGRAFIKTFGASIIVLAPGVWLAPNLNQAYAVGVAALFASVAMGFTAVQQFVPALSFASWLPGLIGEALDAFAQGFLGALIVSLIGILNAPHLGDARSVYVAALTGAINAGLRAVQGKLSGETAMARRPATRPVTRL